MRYPEPRCLSLAARRGPGSYTATCGGATERQWSLRPRAAGGSKKTEKPAVPRAIGTFPCPCAASRSQVMSLLEVPLGFVGRRMPGSWGSCGRAAPLAHRSPANSTKISLGRPTTGDRSLGLGCHGPLRSRTPRLEQQSVGEMVVGGPSRRAVALEAEAAKWKVRRWFVRRWFVRSCHYSRGSGSRGGG